MLENKEPGNDTVPGNEKEPGNGTVPGKNKERGKEHATRHKTRYPANKQEEKHGKDYGAGKTELEI